MSAPASLRQCRAADRRVQQIPVVIVYAQVEDWQEGKIVRVRYFVSRDQALEAAGLSE